MNERTERMGQRFRVPIIIATLMVIPVMILQGVEVSEPWSTIGYVGDWIIWLTFLAEVLAMLYVADGKWAWVRSNPLDVLIVVLTPPVTQSTLEAVRLLRLLRVVRLFRLASFARGLFTIDGVRYVAFLAFLTLFAGAQVFVIAESEHDSIGEAIYWALGTMTTSGSGDVVATSPEAQAVGSILMVVGLAFAGVVTGAIAQRFIVTEETVTEGNRETIARQDVSHEKLDALAQRLDRLEALLRESRTPS